MKPDLFQKEWRPGKIVGKDTDRSYVVKTDKGVIQRNRVDLKKTVTVSCPDPDEVIHHKPDVKPDSTPVEVRQNRSDVQSDSIPGIQTSRVGRVIKKPQTYV